MGFILAILALFLALVLFPIGLLITFIANLYKRRWKFSFKRLDEQFLSIATSIDASGNVVCKDLFNLALINKKGYLFGNRKETISSVLGKNQLHGNLSWCGILLAWILDAIDKNHCFNSIDEKI